MSLKLYKISQTVNCGYDTYDSAVVVAENKDGARRIHPRGTEYPWQSWYWGVWCAPEDVKAEFVGVPDDRFKSGDVVCASFNAG